MTINDIIRFLSGGRSIGPVTEDSGVDIMGNATGMGTGALSLPMSNSQPAPSVQSTPRRPRPASVVQPPLSPLPLVEVNSPPPVASIVADPQPALSAPMASQGQFVPDEGKRPDQVMPPPAAAASPPQEPPGILSRLLDNSKTGVSPLEYIFRGLGAAGSADPIKAMATYSQLDAEREKTRAATAAANRPKIVGSAGPNGAVQIVQMPDGRIIPMTLDQVVQLTKDAKSLDFQQDVQKAILIEKAKDEVKAGAETRKRDAESAGERVQAGLNVQQLNQIADSLEKTDTATGPVIGLLPKWARDIVTPQGASLQDAAERIIQGGLRATLGGQFTQVEGDRFLARAYNPRLSEQQNAANLRTIAREIAAMQLDKDNALKYFQANGTLEGFVPNTSPKAPEAAPSQASPPPSDQLRAAVTAAGIPFEPEKFQYRIGPNGQVQRKAK